MENKVENQILKTEGKTLTSRGEEGAAGEAGKLVLGKEGAIRSHKSPHSRPEIVLDDGH